MCRTIVLCSLLATSVFSQNRSLSGGFGVFMFGGSSQNISSLNTALSNAGYQLFSERSVSMGGGGYAVINNLLYGGEGHTLSGQNKLSNDRSFTTGLKGRYGIFRIGYVIYSKDALLVYPMAGIGKGSFDLQITNADDTPANPARDSDLRSGGYLLDLGVGASYLMGRSGKKSYGGLMIGLAAGFTWMPSRNAWKGTAGDIDAGSYAALTGPYIRLMFGGAGFHYKDK